MSSIYKKGRDGYYYYQAYVINPVSGKKDKRIFHSLKTKEHSVAVEKQKLLDTKYKKLDKKQNSFGFTFLKKYKYLVIVLPLLILLFKGSDTNNGSYSLSNNESADRKINKPELKNDEINEEHVPSVIEEQISHLTGKNEAPVISEKVLLPSYKIVREDRLSDAFKLGKFFVVVSDPYNSEALKNICEKILKENSDLKNIVVCIYKNNQLGIDIASGRNRFISKEEEKDIWLAMYTFNEIEGAFFNDNPSGFLERF